jgi:hypothetical protein
MVFFGRDGFHRSEASRLLQLAREQPPSRVSLDNLFNRHQQLVQSGAELPTWANGFAPHASSWLTLLGAAPIMASAVAGTAILAAVILTTYWSPPPARPEQPPQPAATAHAEAPSEPIATSAPEKPAPETPSAEAPRAAQSSVARETPSAKLTRDRQPKAAQPRAQDAPPSFTSSSASSSTSREATALRADSVRARADTATPAPATPTAAERRADEVATPAPEPPPPRAVQNKSGTAPPDLELAEMREIKRAESLLSDEPQRALELTRSMQAGFPDGHFREERAYLEVMALLRLGRTRELREKAAAFLRGYPTGLYSSRVRKAAAGKAN